MIKESRSGIEPRSFRLPAYRLTARPNRFSGMSDCMDENAELRSCVKVEVAVLGSPSLTVLNPFTGPACTISELKDARTRLQIVSYNTSTVNATRFDKAPFTCQCEKEDKKAEGLGILLFYWSFSSDITTVKGLIIMVCVDVKQGPT